MRILISSIVILSQFLIASGGSAEYYLKEALYYQEEGDVRNYIASVRRACELKSGLACVNMSVIFLDGQLIKPNSKKALLYAKKACSYNFNSGCLIESSIYLNGDRKIKDLKKGVKSLKKACQLKEAHACMHLGIAYINANYGLKRDEKKAKIYLKKACSFGLKDACI